MVRIKISIVLESVLDSNYMQAGQGGKKNSYMHLIVGRCGGSSGEALKRYRCATHFILIYSITAYVSF